MENNYLRVNSHPGLNTSRFQSDKKLDLLKISDLDIVPIANSERNSYNNSIVSLDSHINNNQSVRKLNNSTFDSLIGSKQISWTSKNMLKVVKRSQNKPSKLSSNAHSPKMKKHNLTQIESKEIKRGPLRIKSHEKIEDAESSQENIDINNQNQKYATDYYRGLVRQKLASKQASPQSLTGVNQKLNEPNRIFEMPRVKYEIMIPNKKDEELIIKQKEEYRGYPPPPQRYNPFDIALDHKKIQEELDAHQFSFGQKNDDSKAEQYYQNLTLDQNEANFLANGQQREVTWQDSLEETQFRCKEREDSLENVSLGSDCNVSLISGYTSNNNFSNNPHAEIKPQRMYPPSSHNFISNRQLENISQGSIKSNLSKNEQKFKINTLNLNQLWNERQMTQQSAIDISSDEGLDRNKVNDMEINGSGVKKIGFSEIRGNGLLESKKVHKFILKRLQEGAEDKIFSIVNQYDDGRCELKSIKLSFSNKLVDHITLKILCTSADVVDKIKGQLRTAGQSVEYKVINQIY